MKQQNSQFIVIGIVFLLIAGACAAPAAPTPTPTLAPPTLAPTAVPPTLAPTPAPPTPALATEPATLAATSDPLVLIKALQDSYNKRDTEGFVALLADSPSWGLLFGRLSPNDTVGGGPAASTQAVRNLLAFQFELNTQLEASNCTTKNDQATCTMVIKDDCTPPALDGYQIHTQFTIKDGKISAAYGRWDSTEENAFNAYDAARQAWARLNLPEDVAAYNDYNEWSKLYAIGGQGQGKLSASEFGQAVERICKGYAGAAK